MLHNSVLRHASVQLAYLYVFTIPVAIACWKWIEVPGILLGRHLIAKLEGRAVSWRDRLLNAAADRLLNPANSAVAQF